MKSLLLVFALFAAGVAQVVAAGVAQVVAAGELNSADPRYSEIRDLTVLPYYKTLQEGEVASLGQYLSAKRYAANRALIEQNTEYPDHLRKHFKGAGFELLRVTEDEQSGRVTALVKIYWPNGRETEAALGLIEDPYSSSDIRWKIDRD